MAQAKPQASKESLNPLPEAVEQAPEMLQMQRERADLALEIEQTEQMSIGEEIKQINASLRLNEQKELAESLEAVIEPVLFRAFKKGEKLKELSSNALILKSYFNELSGDQAAKSKIEELMSAPNEVVDDHIKWWMDFVKESHADYTRSVSYKETIENGEIPKGTEWMGTSVRFALVAAGAVGAFFLWKEFKKKKDERKPGWMFMEGAIATLGLGALIGPERMGRWSAKHLGVSLTAGAFIDFFKNIGKGQFKKAAESLKFETQQPEIIKAAKEWDIPEEYLIDVKDQKFKKLKKAVKDESGLGGIAWGMDKLGVEFDVPGIGVDNDIRDIQSGQKLIKKIEENATKLEVDSIQNMSISEILFAMMEAGIFEPEGEGEPKTPEESPDKEKPLSSILERKGTFPASANVFERWKEGDMNMTEALKEFATAAVIKDGAALVSDNGGLFLMKGAEVVVVSTSAIVVGAMSDLLKLATFQEGSALNAASYPINYFERGGGWWIGAGSLGFGVKEYWNGGRFSTGAVKGAMKGIRTSHTFLPKAAVHGSNIARTLRLSAQEFASASAEQKLAYQRARALFHAEQFEYYQKIIQGSERTGKLSGIAQKAYMKLDPDWVNNMRVYHGKAFIEAREVLAKAVKDLKLPVNIQGKVTLEALRKETTSASSNLTKEIEAFKHAIPESALPDIPEYIHEAPTAASYDEAVKKGASKIKSNPKQLARMKKLGMTEELITRLAEYEIKPGELDELISEMEKNPSSRKAVERVLSEIRYKPLFKAVRFGAKALPVAMAFITIYQYDKAEDKMNFIGENAAMTAAFISGWKATDMTLGSKIPNPFLRVGAGLAGGVGSTLGAGYIWEAYGTPYLERNYPNREEFMNKPAPEFVSNALLLASLGFLVNSAEHVGSYAGLWGSIDETSDPLKYLQETRRFIHPKSLKQSIKDFTLYKPLDDHNLHDWDELKTRSQEKTNEYKEELKTLSPETDTIRIDEIERAIPKLETFVDGSWLQQKKLEMLVQKIQVVEPAYDQFHTLIRKEFGAKGEKVYEGLMTKVQTSQKHVNEGDELTIWQFLVDKSVSIGEGADTQEISFIDFTSFAMGLYYDGQCIEVLEKAHPVSRGEV